jgi:short-subunit dehydrogenase
VIFQSIFWLLLDFVTIIIMKRAIIIGATSGIGRALANILADNHYLVGITGRRTELLNEMKTERPQMFFPKIIDVDRTADNIDVLEELTAELGGLDLFIICAGIGNFNPNLDFAIEKNTIQTNVSGFTFLADWAMTYFVTQNRGHLAAITSVAGLRGSCHSPSYNASKAYQINYLEGLRQYASRLKMPVYISEIRPGFVDTAMAKGESLFWVAPPVKAARQIFATLQRKKKVAYVTKRWSLIGLFLKLVPNWLWDKIV